MLSGLIFKSVTHFEFVFVHGIRHCSARTGSTGSIDILMSGEKPQERSCKGVVLEALAMFSGFLSVCIRRTQYKHAD